MAEKNQYLYLNFKRNRERLTDHLHRIRKAHGGELFPTLNEDTNILAYFVETFFERDAAAEYYLANTSLKDEFIDISVRPRRTDMLEAELPPGITLCIRGGLYPRQHSSPELLIDRISSIADSPPRDFEVAVTAIPEFSDGERPNNIFNGKLLLQLPEISKKTGENLIKWKAYLAWKKEIVESQLAGIRYISVKVEDRRVKFGVVAADEADFRGFERQLRNEDLMAFPLRYSTDRWEFNYNRETRSLRPAGLGRFQKIIARDKSQYKKDLDECPWPDAYPAEVHFSLTEDDQADIESASDDEQRKIVRRHLRKRFPDDGFLAVSLIGEFALIHRQMQSIRDLELESGYAPFLTSWLFDIEKANTPQIAPAIKSWLMKGINADQQKAVQKMLGAPDVALIQGPPGTGKTTVIGEAIYQFTRTGKRVLLASQANLAVDNALEKLAAVPEIRAIRLGRSHKFSPEGQEFAEDKVLKKFYTTISEYCEKKYQHPWQEIDIQLEALQKQLDDITTMESSLNAIKTEIADLDQRQYNAGIEYLTAEKQRKDAHHRAKSMISLRENLTNFIKLLHGNLEVKVLIPDKILDLIQATIIASIDQLRRYKIDLNQYWHVKEGPFSTREKTDFFKEILKRWFEIQSCIPRLEAEIERLNNPDTPLVIDPETRLKLNKLNEDLFEIESAMDEGDERQLLRWREIRQAIQEIETTASIDIPLYTAVFNMIEKGRPFYERLINPNLEKRKLLIVLNHTTKALRQTEERIAQFSKLLINNVQKIIGKLSVSDPDDDLLKKKAEHIEALNQSKSELKEAFRDQQAKMQDNLLQLTDIPISQSEQPAQQMQQIRARLEKSIADLETRQAPDRQFRENWEPFLKSWLTSLNDPAQIANDNDHFIATYIDNCNVIGITCNENRRTLEGKGKNSFDVAIIDEVSKATPPELLMPMMQATKTILVGDHRQLPPLFKEQEGSWQEAMAAGMEDEQAPVYQLLTRSNFYKFKDMVTASLFKQYFENAPAAIKTTLYTQYRMHPQIMEVINHFYDYRLKCGLKKPDKVRDHELTIASPEGIDLITPKTHALWIDTSRDPQGKVHYETQSGTSKVNTLEATLIVELLKKMDAEYKKKGYGDDKRKTVGVISFYGKQVAEIRRRVKQHSFNALYVDVNTVDRFQGKERPIILVSLVRNNRGGLQTKGSFVAQFERINVAFSRAQELLVIFGARDMFADCEVELPLMDQPGVTTRMIYNDIINNLNRASCFWNASRIVSPESYKKLGGAG